MLKSKRDSMNVHHQGKFCFVINWSNNSTRNILICLVLQIRTDKAPSFTKACFNLQCGLSVVGQCSAEKKH